MSETPRDSFSDSKEEKPVVINPDGSIKLLSEEGQNKADKAGIPPDMPVRKSKVTQREIKRELKPDIYKARVESYNAFKEALNPKANVVYYPANEIDVSPSESFPESRVIYADINEAAVEALKKAGYEAHHGSASEPIHEKKYVSYGDEPVKGKEIIPAYTPDVPVDILILQNAAMTVEQALDSVREGGYVLANDHLENASTVRGNEDYELVGIINTTDQQAEKKLDTDRPEDYWKTVETDEEFKKAAPPHYYSQIAKLVEEKTGKKENIVQEFKKIVEDMRKNPPPGVIELTEGAFFNKQGEIVFIDQLPPKKGSKDDTFVFRKKAQDKGEDSAEAPNPETMTFEEYAKAEHEHPYVFELENGEKKLVYFGASHSYDPSDPMFVDIEEKMRAAKPQMVFVEGIPNLSELASGREEEAVNKLRGASKEELITKMGEPGFALKIAAELGAKFNSPEPKHEDQIENLLNKGFDRESIFAFFMYRDLKGDKMKGLADRSDKEERIKREIEGFKKDSNWDGFDYSTANLEIIGKKIWGEKSNIMESKFVDERTDPTYDIDKKVSINEVARQNSYLRDRYMVQKIKEALKENDRIFVVFGASHAFMQEGALKTVMAEM